jgi:hypothetical protein
MWRIGVYRHFYVKILLANVVCLRHMVEILYKIKGGHSPIPASETKGGPVGVGG